MTVPGTAWTWKPVAEPTLAPLAQRGRDREMNRYRAYQRQLAGRPVGEAFGRAVAFLRLAAQANLSHA
jgi:hypothetical protein